MAKINPLQRVALEMAENCELSAEEIDTHLRGLLEQAHKRASELLESDTDDDDPESLAASQQYYVLAEIIKQFGTALLAFDDMEETLGEPVDEKLRN